eukprot:scaffold3842_cov150-Pinguiococcus_pyrenoidosus.AAC.2
MSAESSPVWPVEYGQEPEWWRPVRGAYEGNETALDLSWNSIGDEGVKALAERGLPSVPQLTQLYLYNNSIGAEGARALAERGLPSVPQLTLLSLWGNSIGDEGANALAERGLSSVPQLRKLGLGGNSISAVGATALAERGLLSVPQLTQLVLSSNSIGDEGAKALAERGLPSVPQLTQLDLSSNSIRAEGAKALAERGLPSVPQLRKLGLGGNSIGAEGAKALAESASIWCTRLDKLNGVNIPWSSIFGGTSSSLYDYRQKLGNDLSCFQWIWKEDLEQCLACLQNGSAGSHSRSFLGFVVERRKVVLLEQLLDAENIQFDQKKTEGDGHSLLSLAVLAGSAECFQVLLARGAKLSPMLILLSTPSGTRQESTVLHQVIRTGSDKMLSAAIKSLLPTDDVLLKPGASDLIKILLAQDGDGRVALDELSQRLQRADDGASETAPTLEVLKSPLLAPFLKRVPLFPPRIHLCGPGGAGKTLLRHQLLRDDEKAQALQGKSYYAGRTRGVEIMRCSIPSGVTSQPQDDTLTVHLFDHGGQQEFQVTCSYMLTQPLSIFVVVIPVDTEGRQNLRTGEVYRMATTPAESAVELQF